MHQHSSTMQNSPRPRAATNPICRPPAIDVGAEADLESAPSDSVRSSEHPLPRSVRLSKGAGSPAVQRGPPLGALSTPTLRPSTSRGNSFNARSFISFGKKPSSRSVADASTARSRGLTEISVPSTVADRLADFRNKRREIDTASLTLSNLLSLSAVQREMHVAVQPENAVVRERSDSSAPRAEIRGSSTDIMSHAFGVGSEVTGKHISYVTPEVNKKIRIQLLKQHWLTNRFHGSAEAAAAEAEFGAFVTRYHLVRVRRRLLVTAAGLTLSCIEAAATNTNPDETSRYLVLHTIMPVVLLLLAAACCYWRRAYRHWRAYVFMSALLGYNSLVWSDAIIDVRGWSASSMDYSTMLQTVWLLITTHFFTLGFALDFAQQLALVAMLWLSYLVGVVYLFFRWKLLTSGGAASCDRLVQANGSEFQDRSRAEGEWILLECLLISALAAVLLLLVVHRHNRFERSSFINSFVLLNKAVVEEKKKRGEAREVLALFSNPAAPQQLQLRPLQLGQELKYLMRSVPVSLLACEPAASLKDVEAAIARCQPAVLLFSGHSFAGSLAFELPNGRIELPPPSEFIERLALASRLQVVFLNGCMTGELGHRVCSQLPSLYVICWSSVAEDAAARSFALGFYDALGAMLSSGDDTLHIELAFWSGLEKFYAEGFKLGDPNVYLHPPGHPHQFTPQFTPPCPGCLPPVHGQVQLLRSRNGVVESLRLTPGGAGGELFSWDPVGLEQVGKVGGLACGTCQRSETSAYDCGVGSSHALPPGPPELAPSPEPDQRQPSPAPEAMDATSCSADTEGEVVEDVPRRPSFLC